VVRRRRAFFGCAAGGAVEWLPNTISAVASAPDLPVWKTDPGSTFRSREDWSLRWWIMFALLLSVLFHGALIVLFEGMGTGVTARVEQEPLERIKISPDLLRETPPPIQEIPRDLGEGARPDLDRFKPELDDFDKAQLLPNNQEIDLTPNVQEMKNLVRAIDPSQTAEGGGSPLSSRLADFLGPQSMKPVDLASEMASVREDLLSAAVSEKQMLLDASTLESKDGGSALDVNLKDEVKALRDGEGDGGGRVRGFSNLDDLLGQGGGALGGTTAPILMPTDLLFEYGSADLAEVARLSLMKLGFLIQKNPDSLFIVEGHTDSFGGDEYNLRLSEARAQAVVAWLRDSLRLGTDRIQAVGMGKRALIAPAGGSVEEQAINRRVEIKVRPRK
jgi:outer membrane protein OmpA-like peptidoglycan-associated protein